MIFELSPEQKMVQEQAKRFAENEIKPFVEQEEEAHAFPLERVKKMADLGFFGCGIAEEYGGVGADALATHFAAAGLAEVAVEALVLPTVFAGFDDFWEPFLGRTGPAPSYVAQLSSDQRDRLRAALRERLAPDADGRIALEARAWAVRGFGSGSGD